MESKLYSYVGITDILSATINSGKANVLPISFRGQSICQSENETGGFPYSAAVVSAASPLKSGAGAAISVSIRSVMLPLLLM